MKTISKRTNAEIYLEYVNDWLTVGAMAENYGRSDAEMMLMIEDGKIEHEESLEAQLDKDIKNNLYGEEYI